MLPNIVVFIMIALATAVLAQNSPGVLRGVVLDDTGRPVARAQVLLSPRALVATRINTVAESDRNGEYTFTGLPGGQYQVCVNVENSDFLGACQDLSGAQPNLVAVQAGRTVQAPPVRLERGVRLNVQLDDPDQHLRDPAPSGKMQSGPPDKSVEMYFQAHGRLVIPFITANRTPRGRTLQALVPAGRAGKLLIQLKGVVLEDAAAKTLSTGLSLDFDPRAEARRTFRVKIRER